MIVKILKVEILELKNYYEQEFEIPDSMANATDEEIIEFLETESEGFGDEMDLVHDKCSCEESHFSVEERRMPGEGDGDENDGDENDGDENDGDENDGDGNDGDE